jgi:hypothetical protein
LGVRADRARGILSRWRRAGYAQTGRLGPGPAWCWLTRSGLAVTGQRYAPGRPALGRLAHIRAVLAIRLSLLDSDAFRDGRAWWRSERRIRTADCRAAARPGPGPRYHRVVYLASPSARSVVDRAAAELPCPLGARLVVRELPPGAVL